MTVSAPALPTTMRGVIMHAAGDVRVEDREVPHVIEPTDAVIKLEAACVCGSDLWPYRGIQPLEKARPMGHEYVGTVVEVGDEVKNVKVGDFVVGSFCLSDNTCEICEDGYQSRCANGGFIGDTQAEYTRVALADGTLVVVPGGRPDDPEIIASLLAASDVLGTGWFGAVAAQAGPGKTIAVVGDGAVAYPRSWPPRPWAPRRSSPSPATRTGPPWPASSAPTSSSPNAATRAPPRSRSSPAATARTASSRPWATRPR